MGKAYIRNVSQSVLEITTEGTDRQRPLVVKGRHSRRFYHLAVGPWASYLTLYAAEFLICKIVLMIIILRVLL